MSSLELNNMANWEKLNKKFDETLDGLTNEDWDNWFRDREKNKEFRKEQRLLKAKMYELTLNMSNPKGKDLNLKNLISNAASLVKKVTVNEKTNNDSWENYNLAA